MKVKKSEIFIISVLAMLAATLCFLWFLNKNSTNILDEINDYDNVLNGEHAANPQSPFTKLISEGFIQKSFGSADFLGALTQNSLQSAVMIEDYLFFTAQNRYYLSDGTTTHEVFDNLKELWLSGKIRDEKYIFSSKDKFGLKDIFGNIIIDGLYDHITFNGDTVLASAEDTGLTHIFYKGIKRGEAATNSVEICINSRFISINSNFYDLEKEFLIDNPITLTDVIKGYKGDYTLISPPDKVFKVFSPKTGLTGYASPDGIILEPQFLRADSFVDNCAHAVLAERSENVFLRYNEAENNIDIFNLDNKNLSAAQISFFNGNYAVCYDFTKGYFVIDESFDTVSPIFTELYFKVLGDFALDLASSRFYSISKQEYCLEQFVSIFIYDNYYVCQKTDGYILLNSDLTALTDSLLKAFYFKNTAKLLINYDDNLYIFTKGEMS